ncbi:MAG: QueG-associated DUF1730 domain-containing protein [Spirochaetia bacterium]
MRLFSTVPCIDYPDAEERYGRWVEEERYGSMDFLASHRSLKYRPGRILEGCRSILFIAVPYYCAEEFGSNPPNTEQSPNTKPLGRVAWYATGRDYHKTVKGILKGIIRRLSESFPDHHFRPFVDSGPLDERFYAAGRLGFIGRHGLLISTRYGSRFFLGEILTTAALPETEGELNKGCGAEVGAKTGGAYRSKQEIVEAARVPGAFCPEGCRACIDACPTGALGEPEAPADGRTAREQFDGGGFFPRRCISYLSIEHSGEIPEEIKPLMGDRIFGCDTCQDVCPFNRVGEAAAREEAPGDFVRPIAGRWIPLGEILLLKSREEMARRFAGSPLMRCSVEQLKRNASNAAEAAGRTALEDT